MNSPARSHDSRELQFFPLRRILPKAIDRPLRSKGDVHDERQMVRGRPRRPCPGGLRRSNPHVLTREYVVEPDEGKKRRKGGREVTTHVAECVREATAHRTVDARAGERIEITAHHQRLGAVGVLDPLGRQERTRLLETFAPVEAQVRIHKMKLVRADFDFGPLRRARFERLPRWQGVSLGERWS